MALSVTNNISALNAQQNLGRANGLLSKSLERLSTGLKVNRGADGPSALVISEQQRAQIAGLKTALDNSNKAVSVVQTAEGALNEINSLLVKARSLALDSANTGVNDASAQAANQAEVKNILDTIDNIANTTKFGSKNLLNGASGTTAAVNGANNNGLSALKANTAVTFTGTKTVAVTGGTGGSITTGNNMAATALGTDGTVTIGGGGLTSPLVVSLKAGDNAATAISKIQTALNNATATGGGLGKFNVSGTPGSTGLTVSSNILGTTSTQISLTGSVAGVDTLLGLGGTDTQANGTNLAVTVGGVAATVVAGANGLNNTVQFGGADGVTFSVNVVNGAVDSTGTTDITVTDNSLSFQIGANASEQKKLSIDKVDAASLGSGVSGLTNSFTTLASIDVTKVSGGTDAIKVIDQAISDVSTVRARLGAFQTNSLESNARSLQTTLENTTSAESVIRDTDFAEEIANFTRLQTQVQAGATVLGNANQTTQLVAQLLRG